MRNDIEEFKDFLYRARSSARLTNSVCRAAMTRSRLQSLVKGGFGQGRGDSYVPWIRVTRGNAPRASNHLVACMPVHRRPLHWLSTLEHRAGHLASWLGAKEIREQYPLFPWPGHPHPLDDDEGRHDLPPTTGLLELAKEAGITHGNYIGSPGLPYVAQIDLMITMGEPGEERLVMWSVKPRAVIEDPKRGPRIKERMELERLYAEMIGAHYTIFDGTQASPRLQATLAWLAPSYSQLHNAEEQRACRQFANAFHQTDPNDPIDARVDQCARKCEWVLSTTQRLFRMAAWLGYLDADLNAPLLLTRKLKTGGNALKASLCNQLMGA